MIMGQKKQYEVEITVEGDSASVEAKQIVSQFEQAVRDINFSAGNARLEVVKLEENNE
jgi:hypothetical protein